MLYLQRSNVRMWFRYCSLTSRQFEVCSSATSWTLFAKTYNAYLEYFGVITTHYHVVVLINFEADTLWAEIWYRYVNILSIRRHARKTTRLYWYNSFIHLCFSTNVTFLDKIKTRSTLAPRSGEVFSPISSSSFWKRDLFYARVSVHTHARAITRCTHILSVI